MAQPDVTSVLSDELVELLAGWDDVLAGEPVMLSQRACSRDMERVADVAAVQLMRANAISPAVMVTLFERLADVRAPAKDEASPWETAFASHPADEERMRFFREAAAGR